MLIWCLQKSKNSWAVDEAELILKSVSLTLQKRDLHGFLSSWITDLFDWSWAFVLTVIRWGPETAVVTIHL